MIEQSYRTNLAVNLAWIWKVTEINIILYVLFLLYRTHFVHDSDSLVLEDELQRVKLSGDCIDVNQVVTGVVAALLGNLILYFISILVLSIYLSEWDWIIYWSC